MALNEVCDRCDSAVRRDPALGDRQAGTVDLVFPAYTKRLVLCSDCVTQLQEWIPAGIVPVYTGTARGMDAWLYLPRAGMAKPPAETGGKPLPPSFRS